MTLDNLLYTYLYEWSYRHSKKIVVGLVLCLLSASIWQGYRLYHRQQTQKAALTYHDLIFKEGLSAEKIKSIANKLTKYPHTPYAQLGHLHRAKLTAETQNWSDTIQHLKEAIIGDDVISHIARLRLIKVYLGEQRPADALAVLPTQPRFYKPLYLELQGDALLKQGQKSEACTAYRAAEEITSGKQRDFIRLKLANL